MVLDLNDMTRREHRQDQQSRVFYELSALIFNLLRNPPTPIQFSDEVSTSSRRQPHRPPLTQLTPAGFASLLLGISLSLMLCGSITFFIGFLLMPWVLGLVMVFYVVGIVSTLTMLGRAILFYTLSPKKGVPEFANLDYNMLMEFLNFKGPTSVNFFQDSVSSCRLWF